MMNPAIPSPANIAQSNFVNPPFGDFMGITVFQDPFRCGLTARPTARHYSFHVSNYSFYELSFWPGHRAQLIRQRSV